MLKAVLALCIIGWTNSASALSLEDFIAKGKQVVELARTRGLTAAEPILAAPQNGFIDLAGPGLHAWATDAKGVVVFDLSGQTTPGTDLSKWANDDGAVLMDVIGAQINDPEGTLIKRFRGVPHPRTNQMLDVDFWCGRVQAGAIICAAFWPDAQ